MRVIFMGTTPFSCVVLKQLLDDKYDVVAVVTQPDRPFGRKKILKASPVKEMALEHDIDILQPEKIKEASELVLSYKPDMILTCAYGQIVPESILDYPKYKALNVHASLLPKYRGGAPIHWSIINGEDETGVSLMRMDKGMDSGGVLSQRSVIIEDDDMMSDVEAKLMAVSMDLIHIDLKEYLSGNLEFIEQDASQVTLAYTIQREDEFINFNREVKDVYNHIRGLISWPGAYALLDNVAVKFRGVQYLEVSHDNKPGLIVEFDPEFIKVACLNGYILLTSVQVAGKAKMALQDLLNGVGQSWEGKIFND